MKRTLTLVGLAALFASYALAQSLLPFRVSYGLSTASQAINTTAPPEPVTVPAGTRILMRLQSPLHSTSARAGSGVYLETSMPIVQDGRVVIPAHTQVQGVVTRGRRPGRVKGRAQFRFRFTTLILPNHQVVPISGSSQSLPGSEQNRTIDAEGTIEPVDQIDRDVHTIAGGIAAGALLGSVVRGGLGIWPTAAVGGGLGLAKTLFTRGDSIFLPVRSQVEMVLQQPLVVAGP